MTLMRSLLVSLFMTSAETLKAVASSMTSAKRKYAVPFLDGNGKPVVVNVTGLRVFAKDASGKRVATGETKTVTRPKMQDTRNFVAAVVDAADPDGVGVRVWRSM
jgi:hypothetical protein